MKWIKFGFRKNLLYPIILVIIIALRRGVQNLIERSFGDTGSYLLLFLIYSSKLVFGLFSSIYFTSRRKLQQRKEFFGIKLIKRNETLKVDNYAKIVVLIIFASFFDFSSTMARFYKYNGSIKSIKNKLRSFQTIFSALLCYFTIRIKIYKHNICSLIAIIICSMVIIIVEIIYQTLSHYSILDTLISIGITIFTSFGRAFSETTEKYLFEFDNVSPFLMVLFEGFIGSCLFFVLFYLDGFPLDSILKMNIKTAWKIIYFSFLLLCYFLLSGFKDIYRVSTIKLYSPMTSALTETVIDPFGFFYNSVSSRNKNLALFAVFVLDFICLILIVFCSFVYNDFIILYCFGLEYNTYLEISNRSASNVLINDLKDISPLEDNDINNNSDEDDDNQKNENNDSFEIAHKNN